MKGMEGSDMLLSRGVEVVGFGFYCDHTGIMEDKWVTGCETDPVLLWMLYP